MPTDYMYSDSNGIRRVPGEDTHPTYAVLLRKAKAGMYARLFGGDQDVSLRPDEPGFVLSNN